MFMESRVSFLWFGSTRIKKVRIWLALPSEEIVVAGSVRRRDPLERRWDLGAAMVLRSCRDLERVRMDVITFSSGISVDVISCKDHEPRLEKRSHTY
jgi:hypothetical protein